MTGLAALTAVSAAPSVVPAAPVQLLSLLPAAVIGFAVSAGGGAGFAAALAGTLALGVAGDRFPGSIGMIIALWIAVVMADWHRRRIATRHQAAERARDAQRDQGRSLQKDVDFYSERLKALSQRAQTRRQLSLAARELGALLDPAEIHSNLVKSVGAMFPGATVSLLSGPTGGAAVGRAFERGQSILDAGTGGRSEMAAPLRSGRGVVGVLHVASASRAFSSDDLRLLDVLSNLATEALENGLLLEQVQQNAVRDGLTGLLNHKAFHERLEAGLLEASRYRQPVSVVLLDVDHFKSVNDTHGHPAGDAILQGLAHVLDRNARDVDVIARYGGEEFVVLLYQTGYAEAAELAERIRQDLAEQPFDAGGKTLHATASFGVATFPEDATSAQQLMRQADQRLYGAKKAGRNRVGGRHG